MNLLSHNSHNIKNCEESVWFTVTEIIKTVCYFLKLQVLPAILLNDQVLTIDLFLLFENVFMYYNNFDALI